MQKKQGKHEALKCTFEDCQKLQIFDGEFCKKHIDIRYCHLCGSPEKNKFCTNKSCYEYTRYLPKPNKAEQACKDMADVCELAHKRTVKECKRKKIRVDCLSVKQCKDRWQKHIKDNIGDHYTAKAQIIFDKHYDYITEITGL